MGDLLKRDETEDARVEFVCHWPSGAILATNGQAMDEQLNAAGRSVQDQGLQPPTEPGLWKWAGRVRTYRCGPPGSEDWDSMLEGAYGRLTDSEEALMLKEGTLWRDTTPDDRWARDDIQFPRLLSEIRATISASPEEWDDLYLAMDLERWQVEELFDRAERVWRRHKAAVTRTPIIETELSGAEVVRLLRMGRFEIEECPGEPYVWIGVDGGERGAVSIRIKADDEGAAVDLWPFGGEDAPMNDAPASTWLEYGKPDEEA